MASLVVYLVVGLCGIGALVLAISVLTVCRLSGRISQNERDKGIDV